MRVLLGLEERYLRLLGYFSTFPLKNAWFVNIGVILVCFLPALALKARDITGFLWLSPWSRNSEVETTHRSPSDQHEP